MIKKFIRKLFGQDDAAAVQDTETPAADQDTRSHEDAAVVAGSTRARRKPASAQKSTKPRAGKGAPSCLLTSTASIPR